MQRRNWRRDSGENSTKNELNSSRKRKADATTEDRNRPSSSLGRRQRCDMPDFPQPSTSSSGQPQSKDIPEDRKAPDKVSSEEYQDSIIKKWQALNYAQGFADNRNNSIIDALQVDIHQQNDRQVENDAILMAIQSHGLQSGSREESFNIRSEPLLENPGNLNQEQENDHSSDEAYFRGTTSNLFLDDPTEFLNQAVSMAIQKKGLTYG